MLPQISLDDQELLKGKKSGGLTLEYGRCTFCGSPKSVCPEFYMFCSDHCKERALRPFLPKGWDWDADIEDDESYDYAKQDAFAIRRSSHSEYREQARELGLKKSRAEALAFAERKVADLHNEWDRRRKNAVWEAEETYKARWIKERDTVLARERDKARQEAEKQAAKDAAAAAEDERWKPKKFEL